MRTLLPAQKEAAVSSWSGRQVTNARAYWRPRLPVPCCRCQKPVIPDPRLPHDGWQVDHWPVPREMGGTETWPAHSKCNMSAGGKRGAAIINARREPIKTFRIERRPTKW